MHRRRGREPDCESCMPPLSPQNEETIEVYQYVKDQVITAGMGQPIAVNLMAVEFVMRMLGIPPERQRRVMERTLTVWHHIMSIQRAEQEAKR